MTSGTPPEELIDRYLLGQATADEIAFLNERLAEDDALRRQYRFRVALEGGYREAAVRFDQTEPSPENATAISGAKAAAAPLSASRRSFLSGARGVGMLTLIVLLAVMGQALFQQDDALPAATRENAIARLVTSVDATWGDQSPLPGDWITAGSFQLEAGTVELEFSRGARVTLQGPSDFSVMHADLLHVSSGNLVARIPEEAIGFTITTDETEVVDLGTEFGLRVGGEGQTEVHVIEGLVEVFERSDRQRSADSVRLEEGQAIRWSAGTSRELGTEKIPVRSSDAVLGTESQSPGLNFLRGNIRLKERVSSRDLKRQATSWIEVIPERRGTLLEQDLPVTLTSPGNYRVFPASETFLPKGTRVDSYLLHFRSTQPAPIRGVIKFDQEILGLVCEADQLAISDPIVGRRGMKFPVASRQYRGLEPRGAFDNPTPGRGGGWTPDDVTISQDMRTLGLGVNVNPLQGVDQLRVLVRSRD